LRLGAALAKAPQFDGRYTPAAKAYFDHPHKLTRHVPAALRL
jgi:hypothetical protein